MNPTRVCTNCGHSTDDSELRFCTECGRPLPELVSAAIVPVTAAETAVTEPEPEPEPEVGASADPTPGAAAVPAPSAVAVPRDEVPTAPASMPSESAPDLDTLLITRRRTAPFLPPRLEAEDQLPIISRAWAMTPSKASSRPQLGRERKMAGDLPDWDLLPPGELVVKRGAHR